MKKRETAPRGQLGARKRISADRYYLNIAREVAARSTCLRRKFGAVIVRDKQIIATGYGGAPRSTMNCSDMGTCIRQKLGARRGEHYEWCRAVHAEQNAMIHASRRDMMGSTLYLVGINSETGKIFAGAEPCQICKRMIINSGIRLVVLLSDREGMRKMRVASWVRSSLGEIKRSGGRWEPVKPKGYGYGSMD